MGNCLDAPSSPNGHMISYAKQEVGASKSTKVHPIPPLPTLGTGRKVESDNRISEPARSPPVQLVSGDDISKCRSVKITVTKKHLKKLLENVKDLESKGIAVQFAGSFWKEEGSPTWRPFPATIPE
ncbi:hypothetical protein Ancab_033364 [Ancistrocladus abbreviatus]